MNQRNADRAPLLFVAGENDHLMPPKIQRSNAKHHTAPGTVTDYVELPGRSHLMPARQGWEEVAAHALEWALDHTA
ncbi:hypothetical protein [Streptomyces sp. NPDC016675]|uniref:hypothetical protein n=1 Tax=Streptomyces sp. NPDC016675 TaxID=3364970 RepID=UPI0036F9ECC0